MLRLNVNAESLMSLSVSKKESRLQDLQAAWLYTGNNIIPLHLQLTSELFIFAYVIIIWIDLCFYIK